MRQAHDELEQRVRERTVELRRTVEHLQLEMDERLKTEEMLRQSEARFRAAFYQSAVGAVIVDQDLRFQRVNPAFCRIIGYTGEELASMNVADISHPEDLAKNLEAMKRFLAGELNHVRMEERNIRQDGAVIWIDVGISVINRGRPIPSTSWVSSRTSPPGRRRKKPWRSMRPWCATFTTTPRAGTIPWMRKAGLSR